MKTKKILWNALIFIVAFGVGFCALEVITGRYDAAPVLSGSMRPGFSVGGIVIARRTPVDQLAVGDVVILAEPGHPGSTYVHRITQITQNPLRLTTKGDANPVADPWGPVGLQDPQVYRVTLSVPFLGYAAVWLHQPGLRVWVPMTAGILLLVWIVLQLLPARVRRRLSRTRQKEITTVMNEQEIARVMEEGG